MTDGDIDFDTRSTWDAYGLCVGGAMKGIQLKPCLQQLKGELWQWRIEGRFYSSRRHWCRPA